MRVITSAASIVIPSERSESRDPHLARTLPLLVASAVALIDAEDAELAEGAVRHSCLDVEAVFPRPLREAVPAASASVR